MKCRQAVEKLPSFVGGDLPPAIAGELEEHLESCESCRAELARYEDARRSLFVLKGAVGRPAPDLWPSIRAQLGEPPRRVHRAFRITAAAAAALLVAVLGASLLVSSEPVGTSTPKDGTPEDGVSRGAEEVVATRPHVSAPAPARREFLLDEVLVGGESTDYETAPSISTLDPERSGWDEF